MKARLGCHLACLGIEQRRDHPLARLAGSRMNEQDETSIPIAVRSRIRMASSARLSDATLVGGALGATRIGGAICQAGGGQNLQSATTSRVDLSRSWNSWAEDMRIVLVMMGCCCCFD